MTDHLEENKNRWDLAAWTMATLLGLLLLRQLGWTILGALNVDELENLQVLWLWERDVLPFRDYLHSHMPIFSFVLYPLYALFGPSLALPGAVRLVFFPLQCLLLWQVFWLGRRLLGSRVSGYAALGFFLAAPVVGKSLGEVRGDTLAYPLALAAVMCFSRFVDEYGARLRWFYLTGLLFGLSLIFTQKVIFLFLATALYYERFQARGLRWGFWLRLRRWWWFTLLFATPFATALGLLAATGVIEPDGLAILPDNGLRFAQSKLLANYRLVLMAFVLVSSLPILLPAGRIALERQRGRYSLASADQMLWQLAATYAVTAALQLLLIPVLFMHLFVLPFLFFGLLAARFWRNRSRRTLTIVLAISILLAHLQLATGEFYRSRRPLLRQMAFLAENVPPDRPVLDGLTGAGAFRPIVGRHLYYRPFFFSDVFFADQDRAVIEALARKKYGAVLDQMVFDLRDQDHSRYISPAVARLIRQNYYPVRQMPGVLLPRE